MEHQDIKPSSLNGHGVGRPESQKHAAAPATLLPAVLSRLGLVDGQMAQGHQVEAVLRDEHSHVRVAVVRKLGERKEASSLPLLLSALHDPAWEVRAAAVCALGAFGEYAPFEDLRKALADEDASVRAMALRVLFGVRGQIPAESLAAMLQDADWLVREAATLTVEELGEQAPPGLKVARNEYEAHGEPAPTLSELSHIGTLPLAFPSLPLTAQRVQPLEVLGGRYRLQGSLGRGGMATIYRGWDRRRDRVVAIKVLRELYSTEPKFVKRFEREAKAASTLHHPNVVEVFDYGQIDGSYYIVMELVEGMDLRRYLRSRGDVLDTERAIIIAHDVALGLGAAHRRGIVHRDVKPQNVLVGRDGSIKLTDFGIVSVYQDLNASRLTTTGMTLGTIEYMPPEQAQGEIVSPAADVYALGIVMYEMLTGRTPFDGETPVVVAMQHIQDAPRPPSQLNPNIPPALEEIILRCLEKVPGMRYRDGSKLARALESFSETEFAETLSSLSEPQQAPSGLIAARLVNNSGAVEQGEQPASSLPSQVLPISVPTEPNGGNPEPTPVAASRSPLHLDQPRPTAPGDTASRRRRHVRALSGATALIFLVASVLLAFSIYLDARMGFIKLPFLTGGGAGATPTVIVATVPDLRNDDYAAALKAAKDAGFQLRVDGYTYPATPPASYVVTDQSPLPDRVAQKGTTIEVVMHVKPPPSPTPTPSPSPT